MIAYAPSMSFLDRLRNLLAGPPRIQGGNADETVALKEELGTSDQGAADVEGAAETGGGYVRGVDYGSLEAAGTAQDDLATEDTPPDLDQ
jgi:hypothetical protein